MKRSGSQKGQYGETPQHALDRQRRNARLLTEQGLYDPRQEHDACGVGLVAAIDGTPRRDVVDRALEALASIWHRGAVAADGKTGDGAGIHVQVSQAFFRDCVVRTGHTPLDGRIAVGMIFLPRTDYTAQEACRTIVETEILRAGYYNYGWRQVPVDVSVIGEKAAATRPEIEQILFACDQTRDIETLDRDLYLVRRRIEKRVKERGIKDFYICSLSAHSLIYKGMFLAEQLPVFYPDLADRRFISSFAIYHQRYSTNTVPTWWLAQPFRMLAHNGEINTLQANINWMMSHEIMMAASVFGDRQDDIRPVIGPDVSDSAALDAVFEVIVRAGRNAPMAKTLLMPEARNDARRPMPDTHQAMYAHTTALMEPWDGPAAIAATDGRWVVAGMDRNGLRPMRYLRSDDGLLIVGSECGLCAVDEEHIVEKGRIGPGEMIGVDLACGRLFHNHALKDFLSQEHPFKAMTANLKALDGEIGPGPEPRLFDREELRQRQYRAGLSVEDLELILHPMAADGKEAVGSMGDDTPLAVLSDVYRPLSHFLRQKFSQVTNPPIDSLREARVMSLRTRFGNLRNVLTDNPFLNEVISLESPILLNGPFERLMGMRMDVVREIDCTFVLDTSAAPSGAAMRAALDRIRETACEAVRNGRSLLVLSDMSNGAGRAPLPMILATAAVHTRLVAEGLRNDAAINVRTAECIDTHSCAMLISCGATTVNPYLAQDTITERHGRGLLGATTLSECVLNYKKALEQGLLKIMSKMGISVVSSYRAGFNFEAVGLSRALVDEFFPHVSSRISGIGLAGLETKIRTLHKDIMDDPGAPIPIGGYYRYRAAGETHAFQGPLIHTLQEAVTRGDARLFKIYGQSLRKLPPVHLRDLMDFREERKSPIPVEQVENVNEIRKRFVTPGMSLGALSPEAHEVLNIAMNRIGAKSDSGEGGEDPERFQPRPDGDNANSVIKQVASGRFGVTAEYLNQCREIEIKIAQGAKPGEGGQLPGFKVTDMIARFRHATPGVTLISPPPHHDIYSIEDLAQLIYDLKQINPSARVCVKLVAASGIGTIASGVAKAMADVILVSGHVGGTGASPQTSIKFAGIPWEMGLSEVNQVLTLHDLRHRVTLRTDGGIRTGRDVVIAALLGAEEFGIGTASLVAMGCIMVRQCHSNTCPVGVCTQDEALRARFTGTPEKVVNLMSFIAEEVREILADLGATSLEEIIGRTDLLMQVSRGAAHLDDLDLNPLLVRADPGPNPHMCGVKGRNEVPDGLDAQIIKDAAPFLEDGQKMQLTYAARNTDRAIGTRISSHIVRRFGMDTLAPDQLTIRLHGSAGQSLGAFAPQGLTLEVFGEANDYVGKGLSGGTIILRPARESRLKSNENTILGNTVLYGATGGKLFAAGQAGERFAVRNSGATAVIEGCGSNGCEYMTGGTAVILGAVGPNFAAGMTGGMAFVLDTDDQFLSFLNPDTVVCERVTTPYWAGVVRGLIEDHVAMTQSDHGQDLLASWDLALSRLWQICPTEMLDRLDHPITSSQTIKLAY